MPRSTTSATAVDGLSSGIKWRDIIDAFVKADRASTNVLENRKLVFQNRLESVRTFNAKLLSFQLDVSTVNRASLYNVRQAQSSSTGILTATATATAQPGTYQFQVVSTANANQVATTPQLASNAAFGAGTISLRLGNGANSVLTIDAAGSSLSGIAQTINGANLGVNASVLNTGSGYQLMLASRDTGTANAITVSGTGALSGLFTGMTTVQAATDASLKIGSGAGAITITQASNTFKEVVPGVSLTATGPGTATVTVGTDTKSAKDGVKAFVDSFNGLVQYMKDNGTYDPATKKAGVLFSESDVRSGFNRLTQTMLQSVANRPLSMATLSSIGLTIDRTSGKLSIDDAVLESKLAEDPTGVSKLFTSSGNSTDPGVQFGLLTSKTKTTSPFAVSVSVAATRPKVAATADLDASTVIDGTNKDLTVSVNGRDYTATLVEGTYTRQQLADHVQTLLNQRITTPSDKLTVALNGNGLSLAGLGYGIAATIEVGASSTANSALRLATNKSYGTDVVGTIDGVAATGTGQVLIGASGTNAEGLRVTVTSESPVAAASLTVTKGIAQVLSERLQSLTDSTQGTLVQKQDSLESSINGLTKSITATDARLEIRRARYETQFQAMERSINQSNSLSSYLTGQIKGFENAAKGY